MSFSNIINELTNAWEQNQLTISNLLEDKSNVESQLRDATALNTELQESNSKLQAELVACNHTIASLNGKISSVEDEQRQFTKVSRIVSMDKENAKFKEQIALLERRVDIYKGQLQQYLQPLHSQWKTPNHIDTPIVETCSDEMCSDEMLQVPSIIVGEICELTAQTIVIQDKHYTTDTNPSLVPIDTKPDKIDDETGAKELEDEEVEEQDEEENDIQVTEKKIKGQIYYVSDDGDVYIKEQDDSIGELVGKLEQLVTGKTKIKWFKP